MRKYYSILIMMAMMFLAVNMNAETLHDFEATTIDGETLDFSTLKGKRLLIVNTASQCGYTYQYAELQQLYELYGGDKFLIIGFPANNFGNQEPGNDDDIKDFCESNYGVTFQMMSKISVKGPDMHEIYQWLTQKSRNGVRDAPIQWNFQKFMIDENGEWVDVVMTQESPLSSKIQNWLDAFTDVEDDYDNSVFQVYPNPASATLNLPNTIELNTEYHIYNSLGIEVMNGKLPGHTIDIQALAVGTYNIRINNIRFSFVKN